MKKGGTAHATAKVALWKRLGVVDAAAAAAAPAPAPAPASALTPAPTAERCLTFLGTTPTGPTFQLTLPPQLAGTSGTIQEAFVALQNRGEPCTLIVSAPGARHLPEHTTNALFSEDSRVRPAPTVHQTIVDASTVLLPIAKADTPTVLLKTAKLHRKGNRCAPGSYETVAHMLSTLTLHNVPAITANIATVERHAMPCVKAGSRFRNGETDVTEYREGADVHTALGCILPLVANVVNDARLAGDLEAHVCLGVRADGVAVGCAERGPLACREHPVATHLLRESCKVRGHCSRFACV